MKKTIYFSCGVRKTMSPVESSRADSFERILRSTFGMVYDFMDCGYYRDPMLGYVWEPSVPCDGLVLALLSPQQERVQYEILKAVSPLDRKLRPVPVLCIGFHPLMGPRNNYSRVTIAVQSDQYEYDESLIEDPNQSFYLVNDFLVRRYMIESTFDGVSLSV